MLKKVQNRYETKMTFKVDAHQLVNKHLKASDAEREALLKKYNIDSKSLPKIMKDDPAVLHLNLKLGDIVKIERQSKTAGKTAYYRAVTDSAKAQRASAMSRSEEPEESESDG